MVISPISRLLEQVGKTNASNAVANTLPVVMHVEELAEVVDVSEDGELASKVDGVDNLSGRLNARAG